MGDTPSMRLSIERFFAGELSGDAAARIEKHLRTCSACNMFYKGLARERQEFLRIHPFQDLLRSMRGTGEESRSGAVARPSFVFRPALVAAFALVLSAAAIVPIMQWQKARAGSGEIVYKGGVTLSYLYKRAGQVHAGAPGDVFYGGDEVQVFYSCSREMNVSLFSIDAAGKVSFYQPDASSKICSIRSGVGARLAWPQSIELDNASGGELVVALFSAEPFDTERVKAWVDKVGNGRVDLPALEKNLKDSPPSQGNSVATILLNKG